MAQSAILGVVPMNVERTMEFILNSQAKAEVEMAAIRQQQGKVAGEMAAIRN